MPIATEIEIELVNPLGQTVSTERKKVSAGTTTLHIPMQGIASGVYLVKVSSGKETIVRRVALVR